MCVRGKARGSRREWGWVAEGIGRVGEVVESGVVVGVVATLPKTSPIRQVSVLVLVLLSVVVGVSGARACARTRQLACTDPTRARPVRCARVVCLWGGWGVGIRL